MPLKQGTETSVVDTVASTSSTDKKDAPKAGDGNLASSVAACVEPLFYKKDAPKAGDGNF